MLLRLLLLPPLLITFGCDKHHPVPPEYRVEPSNVKRGQVYYRSVCTDCHQRELGRSIAPMDFTMAQWDNYFTVGLHSDGDERKAIQYFTGQTYRQQIAGHNEVARVFSDISNQEMSNDVRSFAISRAKDSDNPGSCQ